MQLLLYDKISSRTKCFPFCRLTASIFKVIIDLLDISEDDKPDIVFGKALENASFWTEIFAAEGNEIHLQSVQKYKPCLKTSLKANAWIKYKRDCRLLWIADKTSKIAGILNILQDEFRQKIQVENKMGITSTPSELDAALFQLIVLGHLSTGSMAYTLKPNTTRNASQNLPAGSTVMQISTGGQYCSFGDMRIFQGSELSRGELAQRVAGMIRWEDGNHFDDTFSPECPDCVSTVK
ncbi:unnamed protein product [Mytilus edulis]|uniref:Uncharacterized protein n=1 Tax=Mytilus edulis TaxID=6550 RepID=A0A8S3RIA4_MYTED|nr:unnamed protein product [Mytilus edulis]